MTKPTPNELQSKMAQVRSGESTPDLHKISGNWYADERGQVGKFTTLDQIESQKKYAIIQSNNEQRSLKHYVNCYHEPIREITHKLNLNELGAVTKLLPFLRFKKDGLLTKDGKPMKASDIADVIGKKERATKEIIKSLVKHDVLRLEGATKAAVYYVNERFHTIGHTIEGQAFTKLYQKETRLRAEKLAIQEAGLLYKILPYFHYQTYFLCANPDADENEEELQHLNLTQLADIIGEDRKTVSRGINALMSQGFVMKISGFNTSRILVNPDVMFRGKYETDFTDTVRRQFHELERGDSNLPGQKLH